MKQDQLTADQIEALLSAASNARANAYAPYSRFAVGAAVLTERGTIFTGCNIENASYSATMCAERVAVFNALNAGHKSIKAVAVVADVPGQIAPCGVCRQVIAQFGSNADVIMANTKGQRDIQNMKDLLPFKFELPKG